MASIFRKTTALDPRTPVTIGTSKRLAASIKRSGRSRVGALIAARARASRSMRRRNMATMGFLGIEHKFYDTSLGATALVAAADAAGCEFDPSTTSMISTPAQGDTEQSRDGKKIVIDQAEVRGVVNWPAAESQAAPLNVPIVYIALVLDTQSNGAQMNSEDCFKNLNAAAATNVTPMRNLLFGSRFRVLKTVSMNLAPLIHEMNEGAANLFAWNAGSKAFKIFVRFPRDLLS